MRRDERGRFRRGRRLVWELGSEFRVEGLRYFVEVQAPGRGVEYLAVGAVTFVEFFVRAVLDDAPLLEHEDDVRVDDLRDAVRDDDRGALLFNRVEAVLDLLGGHRVEARRRLVEEDD